MSDDKLQYSDRYHQINRQQSITTPVHACIEFITNSIDAYNSLTRDDQTIKNKIDIEVMRDPKESYIIVRDYAKGMTAEEMEQKLLVVGNYSGDDTSRGLFGRGAKDASFIGNIHFSAICNGLYSSCVIRQDNTGTVIMDDIPVNNELRNQLHLDNNGMIVKLQVPFGSLPRLKDFFIRLRKNIYLRDIITNESNIIHFSGKEYVTDSWVDGSDTGRYETFAKELWYKYPVAKLVFAYDYDVPGYEGMSARFELFQSETEIPNPRVEEELEYGIIVCSSTSIHGASGLYYEGAAIDYRWHRNLKYFYGRLICDGIDQLARAAGNNQLNDKNPRICIDPNRRTGLVKDHPFVQALYETPYQTLEIACNRLQDIRDSNIITSGDAADILSELSQYLSENIVTEDILFTWRSKDDHYNLMNIAKTARNIELDPHFLGMTAEELQTFKIQPKESFVPQRNRPSVVVIPTNDEYMDDPFDVQYYPKKIVIRLNLNYPDIQPFCKMVDGSLTFANPGKAMVAINGHLSIVLAKIMVRQEVLNKVRDSSLTTEQLQVMNSHELDARRKINAGLTQRTLTAIQKIKSQK